MEELEQKRKEVIWQYQDRVSIRRLSERLKITGQQVRDLYDDAFSSGEYRFPE